MLETMLDMDGAAWTQARSIDGGTIVGTYGHTGIRGPNALGGGDSEHGFIYDIDSSSWTELAHDGWTNINPTDIEGNKIVGSYKGSDDANHIFVYDRSTEVPTWTTLTDKTPGWSDINAYISNNTIVGQYLASNSTVGFGYDIGAENYWTSMPTVTVTLFSNELVDVDYVVSGIDGNNIVGFTNRGLPIGITFDMTFGMTTCTATPLLNYDTLLDVVPFGIDGANIVGMCLDLSSDDLDISGVIVNGATWTRLAAPNAGTGIEGGTVFMGISGDKAVGFYAGDDGVSHSLIYTMDAPSPVPEPGTILAALSILGPAGLMFRRRKA